MNDLLTASPASSTSIAVVPRSRCWMCGLTGKELYSGMNDWLFGVSGSWGMRRCGNCEVVWLDPQPTAREIPKLYSRYYTHSSRSLTRLGRLREATEQCVFNRLGYSVASPKGLLPHLLSRVPSIARAAELQVLALSGSRTGTLLDIGCGSGDFISRMRSFGWRVSGVDPDPVAVSRARSQGLEVFAGSVSDVPADAIYDVVTLNHVVEHALDPVDLLRECRKHLDPGTGRLIITTPNINSLGHQFFRRYWRGLEIPRHLNLFSPSSLRACVERAGLRLHASRTETRLARMIYIPSQYARKGMSDLGEREHFSRRTKLASYLFQAFEDLATLFKPEVGEELFCECGVS